MTTVDFGAFAKEQSADAGRPAGRRGNGRNNRSDDFEPSQNWVNVGVYVDMKTEDGKGVEPVFVSLARGIPLDDMEATRVTGSNARWRKILSVRNKLLAALQAQASGMEFGTQVPINGLHIQLSKANEGMSEDESDEAEDQINLTFG